MPTIREIQDLYDQGKTEEVLKATEELLAVNPPPEVFALRAWAYYRRKEYVEAEEAALKAGDNETAIRCLAAIAAYHHKNSELMRSYLDQLPESPARDNTFMIYAREPSDTATREEILDRAITYIVVAHEDQLNTANLLNNTARWLLAKGQVKEDLVMAFWFMKEAFNLYGRGSANLHHRASAAYWTSVIMEKIAGTGIVAQPAAEISVKLWKKQVKADPTNPHFQKSLEGAKARLQELRKNP